MHSSVDAENDIFQEPFLNSEQLKSAVEETSHGYSLCPGWTHPHLVNLALLWGKAIWEDGGAYGPPDHIVVTPEKKETIDQLCATKPTVTISEVREKLLTPDEYVIRTKDADVFGFSEQEAFNVIQSIVYGSPDAFAFVPKTWGAEFGENLGKIISNQARISEEDTLSVIELGAGGAVEKWRIALEHYDGEKPVRIIVSDFDDSMVKKTVAELNELAPQQIEVVGMPYNLLEDDPERLPKADLIMGFYVLDSVMQPGDEIWRRDPIKNSMRDNVGTQFSKQKYRIRVSPYKIGSDRAKRISEEINEALEANAHVPVLEGDDLGAVVLERILEPQRDSSIPNVVIEEFNSQEWPWGWVSRPLGTRSLLTALSGRLKSGGRILLGDVFCDGVDGLTTPGTIGQKGPLVYQMFLTESFADLGAKFFTDEQLSEKETLPDKYVTHSSHLKYLVIEK